MGSGISLIALTAMADQELANTGLLGNYRLYLVDANDATYSEILIKIRKHLRDHAEKNIHLFRKYYASRPDLIENHQIIDAFINNAIACIRTTTDVASIKNTKIVFEAVSENIDLKIKLFTSLKSNCDQCPLFLTNTSSIPISVLANKAKLEGKIVGYHFYNPPQKQKLVELVIPVNTEKEHQETAHTLTKLLKKTAIPSNDIAGFIGNGHFMREILLADGMIAKNYDHIPLLDSITKDLLIRPMGIFQLIDYVGLDVCQSILKVMSLYLNQTLVSPLIDQFIASGIKGGQNPDGSQKNGIFQYEKHKIAGYYSLIKNCYEAVPANDVKKATLSIYPSYKSWKEITIESFETKDAYFKLYFQSLFKASEPVAKEACAYLIASRQIAENLVAEKVAQNLQDVNQVLMLGFQHAYGPSNNYY
jgi:3-hydroxyacyl-CoA dehydrogenase